MATSVPGNGAPPRMGPLSWLRPKNLGGPLGPETGPEQPADQDANQDEGPVDEGRAADVRVAKGMDGHGVSFQSVPLGPQDRSLPGGSP